MIDLKMPVRTPTQMNITKVLLFIIFIVPVFFTILPFLVGGPGDGYIFIIAPGIIIAALHAAFIAYSSLSDFNLEAYLAILFLSIPVISGLALIVVTTLCCLGLLFFAIDKIGTFIKEAE